MKEPRIYQPKRYTANTPVARAVSELIEKYGGRLVLEAVAEYCFQHLGLGCFAAGFGGVQSITSWVWLPGRRW